jgi:hypothetical protein
MKQHHAQSLKGYGGYTTEQMEAIVQRAHRERAKAIGDFLAWLFKRRDPQSSGSLALIPAPATASGNDRHWRQK